MARYSSHSSYRSTSHGYAKTTTGHAGGSHGCSYHAQYRTGSSNCKTAFVNRSCSYNSSTGTTSRVTYGSDGKGHSFTYHGTYTKK